MSKPVFAHRGFMLDVCRHYMPLEDIRKFILAAEACGMNRMHWHLTDDQGWRIEIRRYPKLTGAGATRGYSFFGMVPGDENNTGYYTQDEAREVVAFAKAHGIEVIPEIEVPGHASAMLTAYPEFGCRRADGKPYRYEVMRASGIYPNLLCAGRDEAVRFFEDILDEIVELFPYSMVHIGGDEAIKSHWRRCPDCQRRMRAEGLESEDALQRWLVLKIGEYLASKGRQTIVWNDVLAGGPLPKHFIVQQWRGDAPLTRDFLAAGGRVIVSDTEHYYFDYAYGTTDVYKVWKHPMVPAYAQGREENLLGVECPLWTEHVANPARAAFMMFPRMTAVGLRAGGFDGPDWESFRDRLRGVQAQVEAIGLHGAPEALWRMAPEAAEADSRAFRAATYAQGAQPWVEYEKGLVRLDQVERLMERIGMPRGFALHVGDCVAAALCGEALPDAAEGAAELGSQLMTAVRNRAEGPWAGLPEDVWLATMAAFARFVGEYRRAYGKDGFDRGFWTTRQADAKLFRVGELEYELRRGEGGAPFVSVHIPSDARLRPDRLNASVDAARAFLAEYFPEWAGAAFRCESWLLSPALKSLLPEGANIPRFQAAFDLGAVDADSDDCVMWVFALGQAQAYEADALPEDTSLRRGVKALLRSGKHLGSAEGVLARRFE